MFSFFLFLLIFFYFFFLHLLLRFFIFFSIQGLLLSSSLCLTLPHYTSYVEGDVATRDGWAAGPEDHPAVRYQLQVLVLNPNHYY